MFKKILTKEEFINGNINGVYKLSGDEKLKVYKWITCDIETKEYITNIVNNYSSNKFEVRLLN